MSRSWDAAVGKSMYHWRSTPIDGVALHALIDGKAFFKAIIATWPRGTKVIISRHSRRILKPPPVK